MKRISTKLALVFIIFSLNLHSSSPPQEARTSIPGSARSSRPRSSFIPPREVFAIPTVDATFKYMMSNEVVRNSFIKTFAKINVASSHILDTSLNPVKCFSQLQPHLQKLTNLFAQVSTSKSISLTLEDEGGGRTIFMGENSMMFSLRQLARLMSP